MNFDFRYSFKNYQSALIAAIFFGCVAPGTKLLTAEIPPQSLAGLLYIFAGIGLAIVLIAKNELRAAFSQFQNKDVKWLVAATLFGGVLGPAFLTYGLLAISGSTASLLLNLESIATSLIAWFIFKEHFDKRIIWGMIAIVLGCLILSWSSRVAGGHDTVLGFSLVSLACLAWGIDNNVTKNISHLNPLYTAALKGLSAGSVNLTLGYLIGERFAFGQSTVYAGIIGFMGIGVSLVAFIISLSKIGTARTGALFSTAPFIGAIVSIAVLKEEVSVPFSISLILMAVGVWLHLSESHSHEHTHELMNHTHEHFHDEHHQHLHDSDDLKLEPHTHQHQHSVVTHSHPHFPDIHHKHKH